MKERHNLIKEIKIEGDKVTVLINDILKPKYIVEDFWLLVQDQDLSQVPNEVILVPFLLNIAPVVWKSNMTLFIPTMDKNLNESLKDIKGALKDMYPEYKWEGAIEVEELVDVKNSLKKKNNTILFSGGLDSIATSYKYISEKQNLVTIQGADVDLDDVQGWEIIKEATIDYAKNINAEYFFIQSNLRDFLNNKYLREIFHDRIWFSYVQHGMSLTSFMAVPAWIANSANGFIGSTHTPEFFDQPWGSHPKIDNKVKWSNFKVSHDNYELTRQKKIELVVDTVENGHPIPYTRVCFQSRGGGNCGVCEKCSRTMAGFLVVGVDYAPFGFQISDSKMFNNTRSKFENHLFNFNASNLFHWKDIQTSIKDEQYYKGRNFSDEKLNFLFWLKQYDFEAYFQIKQKEQIKIARKKGVVRLMAKYQILPFYRGVKGIVKSLIKSN